MPRVDPALLRRLLPAYVLCSAAADGAPSPRSALAAVLFVDVSGFTSVMEREAQRGPAALERLTDALHALFCAIERQLIGRGGDIQQFAGDSILALWFAGHDAALDGALLQALAAAQAIHAALDSVEGNAALALQVRIGVAAGGVELVIGGGVGGAWRSFAAGAAITQACAAAACRQSGTTLCDWQSWRRVAAAATGSDRADGFVGVVAVPLVDEVADATPQTPMSPLSPAALKAAHALVPASVLGTLDGLHPERSAELRQISCVFIHLGDTGDGRVPYCHADVQAALQTAQQGIQQYGGLLARVGGDDKGVSALAVWGVAGHLYEDDVGRALAAATRISAALVAGGGAGRAGVATGRALAGLSGGRQRCEYTVNGPAVNLAAKLMHFATSGVMCCGTTRRAAGAAAEIEARVEIQLDGEPVPAFRLRGGEHAPGRAGRRPEPDPSHCIVGRAAARQRLDHAMAAVRDGRPATIVIEGPPGIGKSTLLVDAVTRARSKGWTVLFGEADEIEADTPYALWRALLPQVLGLPTSASAPLMALSLRERAPALGELAHWLPVLNDVTGIDLPETAPVRAASDAARSDAVRRVLRQLMAQGQHGVPTLLVIEDLHWSDSLSWALAKNLRDTLPGLSLLVSTRPGHRSHFDALDGRIELITLDALDAAETEELVRRTLTASSVDARLAALVHQASGGHPLFARELTRSLLDQGRLLVQQGLARLARPWRTDDGAPAMAPTVDALILKRIDELPPGERRLLRFASVLGHDIPAALPPGFPAASDAPAGCQAELPASLRLGLARRSGPPSEGRLSYSHALVRDVAYASLPALERVRLHRATAVWLEAGCDAGTSAASIAYHWLRADDAGNALRATLAAGTAALRRDAHQEAVKWLEEALELLTRGGAAADSALRARCERLLGHAYSNFGEVAAASRHLTNSFVAPAGAYPNSTAALWLGIAREGARLLLSRPWRTQREAQLTQPPQPTGGIVESDAFAVMRLSEMAYFNWDGAAFLYAGLRGINDAQASGDPADLALWYVGAAGIAGALRFDGAARHYVSAGFRIATSLGDCNVLARAATFAAVNEAGQGRYARALEHCERALRFSRQCSDARRIEDALVCAGVISYQLGRFDDAESAFQECCARGLERGDTQTLGWGHLGVGQVRLAKRQPEAALAAFAQAAGRISDRVSVINLQGHLALAKVLLGDAQGAHDAARSCLAASRGQPTSFAVYVGLGDATRALLTLRAQHGCGGRQAAHSSLHGDLRQALNTMDRFARAFPIAGPLRDICRAHDMQACGRPRAALARVRRAADTAAKLQMPVEELHAWRTIADWCTHKQAARDKVQVLESERGLVDAVGRLTPSRSEIAGEIPPAAPALPRKASA